MGLFSNKISRDKLKPGDHIYSWRSYIYSHHGIYVGDGKVIHFTREGGLEIGTGTFLDKIIEISVPNHGKDKPCLNCGDQPYLCGVISSCLDCFLAGGNLYLFEYNVSKAIFLGKQRGGTCTIAPSDPSDEVVSRAKFLLSINGFGDYHLLDNNCEDFAIYCKTGKVVLSVTKLGSSSQANTVCAVGFVASLTVKILGVGKSGNVVSMATADSMVSAAQHALSSTLGFAGAGAGVGGMALAGVGGMALAGYGNYCIRRLNSDIGVRNDAVKVPVERLAAVIAAMEGKLDNNKCMRDLTLMVTS